MRDLRLDLLHHTTGRLGFFFAQDAIVDKPPTPIAEIYNFNPQNVHIHGSSSTGGGGVCPNIRKISRR